MRSPYKYITIEAIPQPLEQILDDNSPTNKAIDEETNLAYNAPELKQAVEMVLKASEDGGTMEDIDWKQLREVIARVS